MDMQYFDAHSHIYFPDFDDDREEIIAEMKKQKIATITIGVDFETSQKSIELAEKHDNLFATIGLHPSDLKIDSVFDGRLVELSRHPKVVAIGECGLDYFVPPKPLAKEDFRLEGNVDKLKEVQKRVFEAQIDLALVSGKPLMLHIRPSDKINFDAYKESLEMLEPYAKKYGDKLSGCAHFFVGDMDILKRFLAIGFSVTFGGVLTFAREYDEYVRYAPLDRILPETDAPFVAPEPYRGKRNSPLYIPEVVKAIAKIRGEDVEMVRKKLVENAMRTFGI